MVVTAPPPVAPPVTGGTKSGYGRCGSMAGINEFTELGWITMETGPGHYPF